MPRRSATQSGTWSVAEARAKLGTLIDAARRDGAQVVTKRGKPVVVVVAAEEFNRLRGVGRPSLHRYKDFKEALPAMPKDDGDL